MTTTRITADTEIVPGMILADEDGKTVTVGRVFMGRHGVPVAEVGAASPSGKLSLGVLRGLFPLVVTPDPIPGTNIYVKRTANGGWTVEAHKSAGINKGVTVLATLCGGMMGKRLAMALALTACKDLMADDIIAPDYDSAEGEAA